MSELPNPNLHPAVAESQVEVVRRDRRTELKVKIKSLAAEARLIRTEELRAKKCGDTHKLNSLHSHRVVVVREQARASLLCYAMLRGRPYSQLEARRNSTRPSKPFPFEKVVKMAKSFGLISVTGAHMQVTNWMNGKPVVAG